MFWLLNNLGGSLSKHILSTDKKEIMAKFWCLARYLAVKYGRRHFNNSITHKVQTILKICRGN